MKVFGKRSVSLKNRCERLTTTCNGRQTAPPLMPTVRHMSPVRKRDGALRVQEGLEKKYQILFRHLTERHRRLVTAADALALGHGGVSMVSRASGLSRPTIGRGLRELQLEPLPGARVRRRGGGRRPRFANEQLRELEVLLLQGATAHGWVNNLWTVARIGELIGKHFRLEFCMDSVRRILNERLGWSCQKPQHQLKERNEDEIQRWKTEEFDRVKKESRARNAHLVFVDESGFLLAPLRRRTYAPRGRTPVDKVADPHGRISVIGAITVSPLGKRRNFVFQLLPDNANVSGGSILRFMHKLQRYIRHRTTVVWDSVTIHRCTPVRAYLAGNPEMRVELFPPHASELNPVDGVWSYVKYSRLANYTPVDLVQLRETVAAELSRVKERPDLLRSFIRRTGLPVDP